MKACGADAFRYETPDDIKPAIRAALSSPKPALVEAIVDAEEKPTKPEELRAYGREATHPAAAAAHTRAKLKED